MLEGSDEADEVNLCTKPNSRRIEQLEAAEERFYASNNIPKKKVKEHMNLRQFPFYSKCNLIFPNIVKHVHHDYFFYIYFLKFPLFPGIINILTYSAFCECH